MGDSVLIRAMTETDLADVNHLYNHYVLHSTCTYQEAAETLESRRQWFHRHGNEHPLITAEIAGQVIGWGALSPYHSRSAYRRTVENSVYVHHQWLRRGVGSLLLRELIQRATVLGHRAIIAGIDSEQAGSIAAHARLGFKEAGRFHQVGYKFDRWLDVVYMELIVHRDAAPGRLG